MRSGCLRCYIPGIGISTPAGYDRCSARLGLRMRKLSRKREAILSTRPMTGGWSPWAAAIAERSPNSTRRHLLGCTEKPCAPRPRRRYRHECCLQRCYKVAAQCTRVLGMRCQLRISMLQACLRDCNIALMASIDSLWRPVAKAAQKVVKQRGQNPFSLGGASSSGCKPRNDFQRLSRRPERNGIDLSSCEIALARRRRVAGRAGIVDAWPKRRGVGVPPSLDIFSRMPRGGGRA